MYRNKTLKLKEKFININFKNIKCGDKKEQC